MAPLTARREKRVAPRLPLNADAKTFPGGHDCVVADVSPNGARIRFAQTQMDAVPQIVVFWKTGQAFEVEEVWRRSNEVGVRFIRTCYLGGKASGAFGAAQVAWRARTHD
jgi:hypothetical protein